MARPRRKHHPISRHERRLLAEAADLGLRVAELEVELGMALRDRDRLRRRVAVLGERVSELRARERGRQ